MYCGQFGSQTNSDHKAICCNFSFRIVGHHAECEGVRAAEHSERFDVVDLEIEEKLNLAIEAGKAGGFLKGFFDIFGKKFEI